MQNCKTSSTKDGKKSIYDLGSDAEFLYAAPKAQFVEKKKKSRFC